MPIPKTPVKTSRQILSLVRKNPGATARQIVKINNNAALRQSELNYLRQANIDLNNASKLVGDTYRLYKGAPDFDPELYYGYDRILSDRDLQFNNWKRNFLRVPNIKVFAEQYSYKPIGYPFGNFMGSPTYIPINNTIPKQINIGGRTLIKTPLSSLQFLSPYSYNLGIKPIVAPEPILDEDLPFKNGGVLSAKSGIHIKKANRGKFTDYCGGKVTSECIAHGKASSNPVIRKRATFAANSRKWAKKHDKGGKIIPYWTYNIIHGDE